MKKSLLALAVLASIAGVASAQSSVTIYGVVDAGLTHENGGNGSITKVATGVQSGNRLGFKGTEDLGNGLKANFQLENGFDLDTGLQRQGGRLFGRQAYVGLSGAFGAVNLGRQYNPIFVALDNIDPFGTGLTGSSTNLMSAGNVRVDNSATYASNTYGGFTFNGMYAVSETPGNAGAASTTGASVNYSNGPLMVTAAADRVSGNSSVSPAAGGHQLVLIGATYNFGPVIGHVGFETEKGIGNKDFKYRDIMVGATVPFGPGSFVASYINKTDRQANSEGGGKQFAVGYLYSLSKRTNLYTSYGKIRNDDDATWTVGDASSGGSAPKAGQNSSAFTVGMRHKF